MEAYKKSLNSTIKWIILGLIVTLLSTVGLYIYSQQQMNIAHISDFVHGLQTGISTGLFLALIYYIMKIKKILKDEATLKSSYIEAYDERSQFILSKVGISSFYIETFLLLLGIIIAGFFNEIIALTLLAFLIIKVVLKNILKLYYEKAF